MNRQIVQTKDHSTTLFVPELDEHYHSVHGALQESVHVFIRSGLREFLFLKDISILEAGFGTGLNAWLTFLEAEDKNLRIQYTGIEKYPLAAGEVQQLNYAEFFPGTAAKKTLAEMHEACWGEFIELSPRFRLKKLQTDIRDFTAPSSFDLIYYDAFAPSAQPALWTAGVFTNMFYILRKGGLLVTYCVKGEVRRAMEAAGFKVEKIPGPPGKREMARAFKV